MTLEPLEQNEEIVEKLRAYWKTRNLHFDSDWTREYLQKGHIHDLKTDEFFVYREEGEVKGMISLLTDVSGVAEIRDEIRFDGGELKPILQALTALAHERKIRKLFAFVLQKNLGVYQDLGFKREGTLKDHFVQGENLIIMSKF